MGWVGGWCPVSILHPAMRAAGRFQTLKFPPTFRDPADCEETLTSSREQALVPICFLCLVLTPRRCQSAHMEDVGGSALLADEPQPASPPAGWPYKICVSPLILLSPRLPFKYHFTDASPHPQSLVLDKGFAK